MPHLFNRAVRAHYQARALKFGGVDFLFDQIAGSLGEGLGLITKKFTDITVIGAPCLALFQLLQSHYPESVIHWVSELLDPPRFLGVINVHRGFDGPLPLPLQSQDLILSFMDLHAVNDPVGEMIQIHRSLKPDGLFQSALFGGESLHELSTIMAQAEQKNRGGVSPHVFPMAELKAMGGLLGRAGFALPVANVEDFQVWYPSALHLMREVRAMGEGNCLHSRDRCGLSRAMLMDIMTDYAVRHAREDGKILAKFEVIYLHAWAPHASQQQPLRPGTATHKLQDFL